METVGYYINYSKYLNIYDLPLELDYLDIRPLPEKWIRFDNLKRIEFLDSFKIPPELRDKSGKLIYFSMGSMGGIDIEMMKRLTKILANLRTDISYRRVYITTDGNYHLICGVRDMYPKPKSYH